MRRSPTCLALPALTAWWWVHDRERHLRPAVPDGRGAAPGPLLIGWLITGVGMLMLAFVFSGSPSASPTSTAASTACWIDRDDRLGRAPESGHVRRFAALVCPSLDMDSREVAEQNVYR